jgi:hypothetical protein
MMTDLRIAFPAAGLLPGMVSTLFVDAMPSGMRRIYTLGAFSVGIIAMTVLQMALYYDWMELEHVTYSVGAIHSTASGLASSCIFTITVFFIKNLVTAIFYPKCLTVWKSRVQSDKMDATGARIIQATHQVKCKFASEQTSRVRKKDKLHRKVSPTHDDLSSILASTPLERDKLFASVASFIEDAQQQERKLLPATSSDQHRGRSLREFIISDLLESAGGAEEEKLAEPPQPDAIISDQEAVAAVSISTDRQKQTKNKSIILMANALIGAAKSLRYKPKGSAVRDVRLFSSVMEPLEVTTKKNLGVRVVGQDHGLAFGDFVYRHPRLQSVVFLMWVGGSVLGLLSSTRLLPAWASVLATALHLGTRVFFPD